MHFFEYILDFFKSAGGGYSMSAIFNYRYEITSFIIFLLGLACLLLDKNLIKKILGMCLMDSAVFIFLVAGGYITGSAPPIGPELSESAARFTSPVPSGLVLTGIVVSVSKTAVFLSLAYKFNKKYGSFEADELLEQIVSGKEGSL